MELQQNSRYACSRVRKIGRRKREMKIYFSIALMTGLFLFSIISGNALASMSSVVAQANGKGLKSTDTTPQSKQSMVMPSTSPGVDSGQSSSGTIGTPNTVLAPPTHRQQLPNKSPPTTTSTPTVPLQCSSDLIVTLSQCLGTSSSGSTTSGSGHSSSSNYIKSTTGYLVSCNQTSSTITKLGKAGGGGMKVALASTSNLVLQGGEYLCDLIIPGSTTTTDDNATKSSAKDFAIGYKFGKQDATVGTNDPPGSCGSEQGVTNATACYYGYNQAFNQFCKLGKFGCNS
jgi:hypothetical protein